MWIKCGDELNTCLKNVHQIFWPWKKFAKYLYFSNSIFTMMGAPEKKVILRFFSRHEVIYLCVKFQVSLTCPTGFLPANTTFFTNIWREYFFPNILRVFDQPEVEFSKSGQNWANTRPLLLKTFESSNCVDRHTVQWPKWLQSAKRKLYCPVIVRDTALGQYLVFHKPFSARKTHRSPIKTRGRLIGFS